VDSTDSMIAAPVGETRHLHHRWLSYGHNLIRVKGDDFGVSHRGKPIESPRLQPGKIVPVVEALSGIRLTQSGGNFPQVAQVGGIPDVQVDTKDTPTHSKLGSIRFSVGEVATPWFGVEGVELFRCAVEEHLCWGAAVPISARIYFFGLLWGIAKITHKVR